MHPIMFVPLLFTASLAQTTSPLPVSYYMGIGYDSLTSEYMLNVLNVSFDIMRHAPTEEGYIPDNTNGYSHKTVDDEFYAKMEDWMSNTSETRTEQFGTKATLFGIGGSYSRSDTWTHRHLSNKDSRVATVDSIIIDKTLVSQLDSVQFAEGPRANFQRIAYSIDKGTNDSYARAVWETNLFLRLYGDAVVFKGDFGGKLKLGVAVNTNTWSDYTDQKMTQNAGLNFGKLFGMSASYSYSYDKTSYQTYNSSVVDTHVKTLGGEPWVKGQTYDKWSSTVANYSDLVQPYTISIVDMIVPWRLPELQPFQVQNLREIFNSCVEKHINDNTHVGCMNPFASNYNFKANVHTESACMFNRSFAFGGVYQQSSNSKFRKVNELTQDYTCPTGFTAYQMTAPHTVSHSWSTKSCHSCWLVAHCCNHGSSSESATVTPYMCIAPLKNESRHGAAFGGMYTNSQVNDVTSRNACAAGFHNVVFPLSWDSSKYYAICYAPFDTMSANDGVNFGGIFSSNTPNPDSNNYYCPEGYVRHSIQLQGDTYLYYCTGMNDPHQQLKYIPAGWGDPEPNFVDYYDIPDDNSTTLVLVTNISDRGSYYEQYTNVYDYANPPTYTPTHPPTRPPTSHVPTTHVPTHTPTSHAPTTHGPTSHAPTSHAPTTHGPTNAPTQGAQSSPSNSEHSSYKGTAIAGWVFVTLFASVIGFLVYDRYKTQKMQSVFRSEYRTMDTTSLSGM
jgi:hypothetical protein